MPETSTKTSQNYTARFERKLGFPRSVIREVVRKDLGGDDLKPVVNPGWRGCFRFKEGDASDGEIVDYHIGVECMVLIHTGRVLKRELRPRDLSPNELALSLRVPSGRITDIPSGSCGISADTALRLARHFQYQRPLLHEPPSSRRSR